jgi:hypothetical protein
MDIAFYTLDDDDLQLAEETATTQQVGQLTYFYFDLIAGCARETAIADH